MRKTIAAGFVLALLAAGAAQAAPVTIGDFKLAPQAQEKFTKIYGEREIAPLADYARTQLTRQLTKAGANLGASGGLRVEVTLLSAKPNKPTFKQLGDHLSLDYMGSISIGGARLSAKFIDANGAVVGEVEDGYEQPDLLWIHSPAPWGDAQQGIRIFAHAVGQRYAALTQSRASS